MTTEPVLEVSDEALDHLSRADEVMARLIEQHGPLDLEDRPGRPTEAYGALLRSIVGQQLSVAAARSIYNRLLELFGGETPTPEVLLAADVDALRAAGLSGAKIKYVRSLAEHVLAGDLHLESLNDMSDARVIEELTVVKGVGLWSSHMFLIFFLKRPDVLPVGDLGVRRAVERAYGLEALPDAETLDRLGERWAPYRSLAALYLWESLDNAPA